MYTNYCIGTRELGRPVCKPIPTIKSAPHKVDSTHPTTECLKNKDLTTCLQKIYNWRPSNEKTLLKLKKKKSEKRPQNKKEEGGEWKALA